MTANVIPEPPNGAIVGWFDGTDGLHVALQRDDGAAKAGGDEDARWFFPSYDDTEDPVSWKEACADLEGFDGPVVLVPQGEHLYRCPATAECTCSAEVSA